MVHALKKGVIVGSGAGYGFVQLGNKIYTTEQAKKLGLVATTKRPPRQKGFYW